MELNINKQLDESKIANSKYYQQYKHLNYSGTAPSLLDLKIPLHIHRSLAQVRILSYPLIFWNKFTYMNPEDHCKLCSQTNNLEDLAHNIYTCPHYQSARNIESFSKSGFLSTSPNLTISLKLSPKKEYTISITQLNICLKLFVFYFNY